MLQIREGLLQVLHQYVDRKALTVAESVKIVQDVFFNTSNKLYSLELEMRPFVTSPAFKGPPQSLDKEWDVNSSQLTTFLHKHPSTRYLWFQWLDYTATLRVRVIPTEQVLKQSADGEFMTIANVVLGILQNDHLCNSLVANDVYHLYPRFESLCLGSRPGHATVQCEFRDTDNKELSICPRTCLRIQVENASAYGMEFLVGFEVEVVFMSTSIVDGEFQYGAVPTGNGGHAWSAARALQNDSNIELLETIHTTLERADIELQQFHAESSPGQFEFVLGQLPPLAAVDALLAAREIISSAAANSGLRATLYPKPSPEHCGTGAHIHLSIVPASTWQAFYAGLLKHLRAISAFTYPNEASYERVADGVWAGSTWIAWGTQNRETPLRRVKGSHFEIKCMDGLSNPYLSLAAIVGAGMRGVLDKEPMLMDDCTSDPAKMSSEKRSDLGITQQFPVSFDEALNVLESHEELHQILGEALVDDYITVKREENGMLMGMDPEKRRNWLIERY